MKAKRIIAKILRPLGAVVLAAVLTIVAVFMILFSSWGQEALRLKLLAVLNTLPGTTAECRSFTLKAPLRLDIEGLLLKQYGDTMVAAEEAHVDVALLPLLRGKVDVRDLRLVDAAYVMGSPDSAMYLTLHAGYAKLHPASVGLADMDIDVEDGLLRDARINIALRQDTTPSAPSDPTRMSIHLRKLALDNVTYSMQMLPTIDNLTARIGDATLCQGNIDLYHQKINIDSLTGTHLAAKYLTPDSATLAENPVVDVPADTAAASQPWIISIRKIHFTQAQALYATQGYEPAPGLDFNYIQASDIDLLVTDFYNCASDITLPLQLRATERCGLTLDATGTFAIDTAGMHLNRFTVTTDRTHLNADALMGMGDLATDPSLVLSLKALGYVSMADLRTMFPGYSPYLAGFGDNALQLNVDIGGTAGRIDISQLTAAVNGGARINAKGWVIDPFGKNPGADITLDGNVYNVKELMAAVMGPGNKVAVPPMSLSGHVRMLDNDLSANLKATTHSGTLALNGWLRGKNRMYKVDLDANDFPVNAFMPDLGVGRATLTLKAEGNGLDVLKSSTNLDASLRVASIVYNDYPYRNINLDATIHQGRGDISGSLRSGAGDVDISASGNLNGDTYSWTADIDGRQLDLYAMHLSASPAVLSVNAKANASYSPGTNAIKADLLIPAAAYTQEVADYRLSGIKLDFSSTDSVTDLTVRNRDLHLHAAAAGPIDSLGARLSNAMSLIDNQIKERKINVDTVQKMLPHFDLHLCAGTDNFVNDILKESRMQFDSIFVEASNNNRLSLDGTVREFTTGTTRLDTINLTVAQDSARMQLLARVDNRPGTLDEFAHITINGILDTDRLSVRATQANIQRQTGYDLGLLTSVSDSTISARIFPLTPVIGYRKWSLNIDNRLIYNYNTRNIDVKINMHDSTSSFILTSNQPKPGENDSINDINLKIKDIKLQEFLAVSPFSPQIAGDLFADLNLRWDGYKSINGNGTLSLDNFYYDKKRVASFAMDLDVATNLAGQINADASLSVDSTKVMTLVGALNDSVPDSPVSLSLNLTQFPLTLANPFLSASMAQLAGTLNGNLDVRGSYKSPSLNGDIFFDKAAAKMAFSNTSYGISPVHVPVEDNVVKFNNFNITAANENPLYINGTVDLHSVTSPRIDLNLKATNLMAVNTSRAARNAELYGKLFLNLDASVQGTMKFMQVKATADILSGTNVTYILTTSPSEYTAAQMGDMVKFVNLNDTSAVAMADSINDMGMMLMLNAQLNIQPGTTFTADLTSGARDKVVVQPQGSVSYTQMPMSEGRMIGRINIDGGSVHYTLPVIGSEKNFTFDNGSYVAFNGNILNPTLNVHATDRLRANVTQSGQNSRLIYFDVLLGVTGTLETMNVAFDLKTSDDITVANELQSMSADQRANQAMNLLLYNTYTGPGTSASANLTANPLFSFLESQINNWAANNIKGVDLSFGIDQYNRTTNGATSSTMNYSYRVSKSLFNDKFKIVIGGNYSTDTNAEENLAENLINDISFEYFLNKQQTMVLKLFRHTGYESILEGEVTQTGVGFVYKRKMASPWQLLPKFMRPKRKTNTAK